MTNRDITDDDLNTIYYNFKLRDADFEELYAIALDNPYAQIMKSIKMSSIARCLVNNKNEIYCIYGIVEVNSNVGVVWMVASEEFASHKLYNLKQSKRFIKESLDKYQMLINTCSLYNKESIKYLDWLGFLFDIHSVRPALDTVTPVINFSITKRWYEYIMKNKR